MDADIDEETTMTITTDRQPFCQETYNDAMVWPVEECRAFMRECIVVLRDANFSWEHSLAIAREMRAVRYAMNDRR